MAEVERCTKEPAFCALECNKKNKVRSKWAAHRGCTSCDVSEKSLTDAIAQKVKAMLDPIAKELKPMAGENLPSVEHETLKAWTAGSTKSDVLKSLREGMARSHENAANEGTGRIHTDVSADPPMAYVTKTETQSQNRDPCTVVAKLELNKNKDAVVKIIAVLCDCCRECAGVVFHHHMSLTRSG